MTLLVAWLSLTGVARAVPKCHVYELTVEGVSRDGRYALTTSTDHFGLVDVEPNVHARTVPLAGWSE